MNMSEGYADIVRLIGEMVLATVRELLTDRGQLFRRSDRTPNLSALRPLCGPITARKRTAAPNVGAGPTKEQKCPSRFST